MATAEQVVKAALQRILVQGSEAPYEADEYQDAIFAMNNWMTALDADGVQLGYTVVENIGDTVTIPQGALRGLIANLAIEVAPDYGGVVSPELIQQAVSGLKTMRMLGQTIPTSRLPNNLPRGSGNNYDGGPIFGYWPDGSSCSGGVTPDPNGLEVIESEGDETLLAETTGPLAPEDETL